MTKKTEPYNHKLSHIHHFEVRFNETDPLGIVWHGNYYIYFEQGREAFGKKYNLTYLEIQKKGFVVPIVKSECEYKHPLKYGDTATIETTFVATNAAKLIYTYKIYNQDKTLICTGKTIQVFLDTNGKLCLYNPDFFQQWKNKHLI
ncbi:MAG: acyl-CoA thioesterase [Bacteroidota bacterium]|nr:acyl-CoA thioesterase [Bacteroidota bacterium]